MSYGPTPAPKPAPKPTTPAPAPQNVNLIDNDGHVDREEVKIPGPHASGGSGSVTWLANGELGAKIEFKKDGTPFASDTFVVPVGGSVSSGPVVNGGGGTKFHYTVHGHDASHDPVIIVDP